MTIWIEWNEVKHTVSHRRYIGNGEDVPVFKEETVAVRCRYSNEATDEMIQRAHDYVKSDRPDARVVIEGE